MAYSTFLAQRIREALQDHPAVIEKEMMGGLVFMVHEKMCVGIIGDEMMCRIDPAFQPQALEMDGCRPMDFTKRPMKGYVMVNDDGMRSNADLLRWIGYCLEFNPHAKKSAKKK